MIESGRKVVKFFFQVLTELRSENFARLPPGGDRKRRSGRRGGDGCLPHPERFTLFISYRRGCGMGHLQLEEQRSGRHN